MNEPQQSGDKGTRYVILAEVPATRASTTTTTDVTDFGGQKWQKAAVVAASSANAAIRKHAEGAPDKTSGTFVAIPERSWQPTKVTVETRQTVKLG
jgi:hypothetical protein